MAVKAANKILYHTTSCEVYESRVKSLGLVPQPLREDIAEKVGFRDGVYLAISLEACSLVYLIYLLTRGYQVMLAVRLPQDAILRTDPEVGWLAWVITPVAISPESVWLLEGWSRNRFEERRFKTMRFPTALAEKAREVEPNFPMGLGDCEAWLKDYTTCEGCQHYNKCQYFGLGILVAIGRTEEILDEMKVGIGQKQPDLRQEE